MIGVMLLVIIGAGIGYTLGRMRSEDETYLAYQLGFFDGLDATAEPGDIIEIPLGRDHA